MLRDLAFAWVCKSFSNPALHQEFLKRLDAAIEQQRDCFYLLGPKTNSRNKAYLVHCYSGELFVFPLTPKQAKAAGCVGGEMTSGFGGETMMVARGLSFTLKVEHIEIDSQSAIKATEQIRGRCGYQLTGTFTNPWCLCLEYAQFNRGARVRHWFTPIVGGLQAQGTIDFTFSAIQSTVEETELAWRGTTAAFLRFYSMLNRSFVDDRVPLSNAAGTLIEVI